MLYDILIVRSKTVPDFFFFRAIGLRLLRNHEAWQAFDMLDISGLLEIWAAVPWLANGGSSER